MDVRYVLKSNQKVGRLIEKEPFFVADNNKTLRLSFECNADAVLLVNLSNGFETASLVAKNKVVDVPSRLIIGGQLRGQVTDGKNAKWTLEPVSIVQINDAFTGYSAFDELSNRVSVLADDVLRMMGQIAQLEATSEQTAQDSAEAYRLSSDAVKTAKAAAEAVKQLSNLIKEDISQ